MTQYDSGYRFATVYARNHGLRALLFAVRRDASLLAKGARWSTAGIGAPYIAGEVDAALALVQMRGAA
jgi:hypothetical protein